MARLTRAHSMDMMATTSMRLRSLLCICLVLLMGAAACGEEPAAGGAADAARSPAAGRRQRAPPDPPAPMREPMPPQPLPSDDVSARSLDDLNRDSPLQPVFFDLRQLGRQRREPRNAAGERRGPEEIPDVGHHDRRPLRRARNGRVQSGSWRAARRRGADVSLMSLGLDASRLRTVSYGSEFPFDPAHQESAWSRNRRAHFVITAK